jgi:hypothetical protein
MEQPPERAELPDILDFLEIKVVYLTRRKVTATISSVA